MGSWIGWCAFDSGFDYTDWVGFVTEDGSEKFLEAFARLYLEHDHGHWTAASRGPASGPGCAEEGDESLN